MSHLSDLIYNILLNKCKEGEFDLSLTVKYLKHLQLEGKAENTIDTYKYHLVEFLVWISDQKYELLDIKPAHLIEFKEHLLKNGKSQRTVNAIISCIRGYFDFLILNEVVKVNPVSKLLTIKVTEYRQNRLTDNQINDFFHFVDSLQVNVRAAFYLMYATGARVSEVSNLTKEDFLMRDNKLFVNIQDAKYDSDRLIPVLNLDAVEVVTSYLKTLDVSSAPAFRVSKRTLQRHAANFGEKYGIQFSCHVLRHTFATLLLENGVSIEKIQYLLGHRSIAITRHYTQSAFININDLEPSVL